MELIRKVFLCYMGIPDEYNSAEDEPDRVIEVPDRNVPVKFLEYYYGYVFYDVWETSVEVEGRMLTLKSGPTNHSDYRYYGVRVWTPRQLIKKWLASGRSKEDLRGVWSSWRMNKICKLIEPIDSYGLTYVRMHESMPVDESNFTAITAATFAYDEESSSD